MTSDEVPQQSALKIIVVGAGIAGLLAARTLRGPGHEITILEQASMKSEIGAAIHMAPNATKILQRYGVEMLQLGAVPCRGLNEYDIKGDLKAEVRIDAKGVGGAEWTLNHRVDVHNALKVAALDPTAPGPVPVLRSEARVVDADCEAGKVTLADGEELTADLVIGADGIHSAVRTAVLGEEREAERSGMCSFRCLVRREDVADIPEVASVMADPNNGVLMVIMTDFDERIIMYPCRNSTLMNVVGICPDILNDNENESWNRKVSVPDVVARFSGFGEWILTVLSRAQEAGVWQLRHQTPLPTWVRGRAIIIGDAAHAMLPHQGQGAAQAVEDGEALGVFFEDIRGPQTTEHVHAILQQIYDIRHERATTVQEYSLMLSKPKENGGYAKQVGCCAQAHVHLGRSANLNLHSISKLFLPWNWRYEGARDWQHRQEARTAALKL